ncbi:MAG: ribbon-helix-helix protein, CopG family [Chloroflexota bacterium]
MPRGKLGRPPVPEPLRKRTVTLYLATRMVERIDERAARTGLSRNQLIASVLACHFEPSPSDQCEVRG